MGKSLQTKKTKTSNERVFKAMVAVEIFEYKQLHEAVEKKLKMTVKYQTFMKVISGKLLSGPKAEAIMNTVAELVGKKVKTLWPELEEAA
ncbi:hypothetical protein [Candidatus Manganitrophus noduliformans]|uniref:Uncharacterized protein n=1 Tax=Candidatus Manganitrophus noduliformans TaxID=2606439 RepID=A0A7X6DMA1_9BACT|nr:hypothetical protein [Candidatus Manganitrophus noduliformans]NKE69838.1 hypothetical protein [Candidatus Manganitrophus noduliformans]